MKLKNIILLLLFIASLVILILIFRHKISSFALWAFPEDINRNGEVVKLIVNILGGIVIIFGLYAALVRARASQEGVVIQARSIENQTQQIELSTQSQTNENFKNAVEHLGSEKESIVLGGIYELDFIAKNKPDTHAEIVLNILVSKLRSECNINKKEVDISRAISQTLIDIIYEYSSIYESFHKEITFSNLSHLKFPHQRVYNTNFSFSQLPKRIDRVSFEECNFNNAIFKKSYYYGANFLSCNLENIRIVDSKFERIKFNGTYESGNFTFIDSEFDDVQFNSKINGSKILGCRISSSVFSHRSIENVDFSCSSIEQSSFADAAVSNSLFMASNIFYLEKIFSIESCDFQGASNNPREKHLTFKEQLDIKINKNDLGGLDFNTDGLNFRRNKVGLLTDEQRSFMLKSFIDYKNDTLQS